MKKKKLNSVKTEESTFRVSAASASAVWWHFFTRNDSPVATMFCCFQSNYQKANCIIPN